MEVLVLASGSSGNSALIASGDTAVLVDVGVSSLQIHRRLEAFGWSPERLAAILISHEHSDHVCGLEVLLKRHRLPVWATAGSWSGLSARSSDGGEIRSGSELRIGALRITPVATSHDAREPVAFVIDDGERRLGFCTDTGTFTGLLEQRLAGCDVLLLEANHDKDMLRNGPYPWPLKQRIASRVGHLANHQSGDALDRLCAPRLRAVVGLHLSEENNSPRLAVDSLRHAVGGTRRVEVVSRWEMLRLRVDGDEIAVDRKPVPPGRKGDRAPAE
jgi:phosphoribosyl 1,2-cyclic phosphodiesterase